jgi:hypothetical protein
MLEGLVPRLTEHRDAILRHHRDPDSLSDAEADREEILALMEDADGLCARLGVGGTDPELSGAAAVVASAYEGGDLEAVEFAVAGFEVVLRRKAGLKAKAELLAEQYGRIEGLPQEEMR